MRKAEPAQISKRVVDFASALVLVGTDAATSIASGNEVGEDVAHIDREGVDRKLVARRGAYAVSTVIVEVGSSDAEPRPGNVFCLQGNRLAFIDFGMSGPARRQLPQHHRGDTAAA